MPTFDFKCPECQEVFSKLKPVGTKETKCLKCGGIARKIISAPAVHFKGSGFFVSDNNKKHSHNKKNCSKKKK